MSIAATIVLHSNAPFQAILEVADMSYFRPTLLVLLCCCFLAACQADGNAHEASARPVWIDNPGNGVSASAAMHVRGTAAQEELAILRAREEFARRFGVTIEVEQTISTTLSDGRSSTSGAQVSREGLKQANVKAMVQAKWRDPDTDVLWVWLVPVTQ